MLSQKKELFRQEIRKQELDEIFNQNRKKLMLKNDIQLYQEQMYNEIIHLQKQIEIDKNFNIQKFDLLKPILERDLTNQTILLLQLIVKKLKDEKQIEDLENLFEDYHLGSRILSMCEKEQNLAYLDEQLYLLGLLSQSSLLCQAKMIQLKIVQSLNQIIDLEIESDDYIMSTIIFLMTSFIKSDNRIPFKNFQQLMSILDKLCKKLRGINYLDIEFDFENNVKYLETKHSLLNRILLFALQFIDKSQFTTNLTVYHNFWIILTTLAFIVEKQYKLRQTALQVISESIKLNDQQLKSDIIEKQPDIFLQLITIINHHQQTNKTYDKCIRSQASIIIKQLLFEQSQFIIQNIHLNQIPIQFLLLVLKEKDSRVIYHQLEVLILLCSSSTQEQSTHLINNGLLILLISQYKQMYELQDYTLSKLLIQLTFAVLQHYSSDNLILNFMKQYLINQYLTDITINCKHLNTCRIADKLLKYIK
ncbi:unnamed protein product [Paramecium primaurelia]|uniref:Uncharacterized protein n=1 Tax=Paramecium primaurelia TaxID=5886 RepID=A0A8S1MSY5_PARPR|nr:unnamed protein product [Paramecium primaurelia]